MLTLCKPGYNEADPVLLARLRERYIHELPQMQIRFFVRCRRGEPLYGEVWFPDRRRRCSLDGALKNMGGENHTCEGRDSSAAGSAGAEICLSMTGDCADIEIGEQFLISLFSFMGGIDHSPLFDYERVSI